MFCSVLITSFHHHNRSSTPKHTHTNKHTHIDTYATKEKPICSVVLCDVCAHQSATIPKTYPQPPKPPTTITETPPYRGSPPTATSGVTQTSMRALLPLQLPDTGLGGSASMVFHQMPIEASTPDRIELSEAECDIDTLKKLKLGMRSTLWSRPIGGGLGGQHQHHGGQQLQTPHQQQHQHQQAGGHPSDYSIAV